MDKLYVSDLDGTLLNDQETLSEFTINVINEYIDKGYHFTFATARSLVSAKKVVKGLQIQCPVIVYNGCHIIDPKTNHRLHSTFFSKNECNYLYQLFLQFNKLPLVYSFHDDVEKVYYVLEENNSGLLQYLNSRKNDKRLERKKTLKELMQGNIFYFTLIGDEKKLFQLYKLLKDTERFYIIYQKDIYTNTYWLEIMPRSVNKANAIKKLKQILHCHEVVCFGDHVNDLPMFELANYKYAVSNAKEELKKEATATIKSNNQDGVANWFKENLE